MNGERYLLDTNAVVALLHDQDGYYAYVPSLHGCVSQGDTLEEALAHIKEALELYLEDIDIAS